MNIKNTTKLGYLLKEYPQLKLTIVSMIPDFGSLEQTHLKEKVLSITTIEHLAQKTDREVSDLISHLNKVIGIQNQENDQSQTIEFNAEDPEWIKQEFHHKIDGVELLSRGEHPLNAVQELLKDITPGRIILLTTNFHPQPMLEAMKSAGVKTYSRKDIKSENRYLTFIQK